jgi:hypothetical protein
MWRSDGIEALPPAAMMSGHSVSEKRHVSSACKLVSWFAADLSKELLSKAATESHSLVRGQNVKLDQRPFCGVLVSRAGTKAHGCSIATTRLRASVALRVMSINFRFNL